MADSAAAGTALFDLSGHVAAVVGGGGVLGGALCDGFGSAGAAVAVLDRSAERAEARAAALRGAGVQAVSVEVDATDKASIVSTPRASTAAPPSSRSKWRSGTASSTRI
jgi:NAD(P)-dependent dehydrogenase (short-subunit alcohol dehydrogenase family)